MVQVKISSSENIEDHYVDRMTLFVSSECFFSQEYTTYLL